MERTIAYYITILQRHFRFYCQQELQRLGLSQGLLFFILYIGKHPQCSPKELTNALHLDSGHVTRSLSKLEKNHFIQQTINPNDKRARLLTLTKKGQNVFLKSHEFFYQWDQQTINNLSLVEQEQLLSLLKKIQGGLSK
ncbi:MAG: bilirubin utilization transcriptional regulator BilQ [Longibaculum sp.]